jgi:translation elongation factor EF-Tu-like GTPase
MRNLLIVKAKLYLLTPEQGGRTTPIYPGYRPDHLFEENKKLGQRTYYIGDIQFDQEMIQPGETAEVTIRFLWNDEIVKFIELGRKWAFYEVPRKIGEAVILEILPPHSLT